MDADSEKTKSVKPIIQVVPLNMDIDISRWDELPAHIKQGINDSLEQANRGKFISYEEVKKRVSALLDDVA